MWDEAQQHCGAKLMQSALSTSGPSHPESKVSPDIAVCSLFGFTETQARDIACLAFIADDAARSPGLHP